MASKSKKPEDGSSLDAFFEELSAIEDLEVVEDGEAGEIDLVAQPPPHRPPPAVPAEEETAPQGGGLDWITGPAMMMVLRAGLALVLGIFPAVYFGHSFISAYDPAVSYVAWTAALMAFVLLLRPGIPGVVFDLVRNREKYSETYMADDLTFIIAISKITRLNILVIEDVLSVIENSFLRSGLRLILDLVDRNLISTGLIPRRLRRVFHCLPIWK